MYPNANRLIDQSYKPLARYRRHVRAYRRDNPFIPSLRLKLYYNLKA